jgi:peptidoglycan LD-endopeptidase LytH
VPADASQSALDRAQARANRAARELAKAETREAELEGEVASLEARAAATLDQLATLSGVLKERAVQQYIRGISDSNVKLDADLAASTRANALARFVALGNDDALDEYRRIAEDLGVVRGQLEAARDQADAVAKQLRSRADAAFAELRKLKKLEAERRAKEAARRSSARATRRVSGPSFIAGNGSWMCPVQGPHAFSNDWGQPRSGGRTHQGTDILAPRGTPVVASVGGSVRSHNSRLGGLSYYLVGDDGNTYYGAHLDGYVGGSGHVAQGTVIGYVGNSGNARGGPPHLHFEIHPGGGAAVNPYPTVARYC